MIRSAEQNAILGAARIRLPESNMPGVGAHRSGEVLEISGVVLQRAHAVQSLNLALLVHAEDQSFIGMVQVKGHNIPHLGDKLRVRAELEGFHSVQLQP